MSTQPLISEQDASLSVEDHPVLALDGDSEMTAVAVVKERAEGGVGDRIAPLFGVAALERDRSCPTRVPGMDRGVESCRMTRGKNDEGQ